VTGPLPLVTPATRSSDTTNLRHPPMSPPRPAGRPLYPVRRDEYHGTQRPRHHDRRPGEFAERRAEPLPRRRDRRREDHPAPPRRLRAAVLSPLRVRRRARIGPEGRPHVALRGGGQRGDRRGRPRRLPVPGRGAGRAHRAVGAIVRARGARRSRSRLASRSTSPRPYPASTPRRSTPCTASRWPAHWGPAGSPGSPPRE
jgi:hypothetical protein